MDEKGYTKFNNEYGGAFIIDKKTLAKINQWRNELFKKHLIGVYPNGIGYGNISMRHSGKQFIISASKTGGIEHMLAKHYALVADLDYDNNWVLWKGYQTGDEEWSASSESMTHEAIYKADPAVNAVIHVHNLDLWTKLLNRIPTTSREVACGTPEMARETLRLFNDTDVKEKKIFVMAGHKEGVVSFGKDLDEAGQIMMDYFNEIKNN